MPTKQIPLWGDEGIYQIGDVVATYPVFLNGYFEKTGNTDTKSRSVAYVKRPGLGLELTRAFTNNHLIQGVIGSIDRTKIIAYSNSGAANTTWYWDGATLTNRGTAPAAAGSWTNTGPVVFTVLDGISYGANVYYAATDFTKGAVLTNVGVWTEIVDADFTGLTKCTNFVGLDGYLFIGTTNNRIYNSDLNISTSWTPLGFLVASDTPGSLLWLSKIRNYLIAFKDRSIEFFEDVGNPGPGSPLEPRKQLNRTIGCINKSSIQEVSDGIIFAGAAGSQSAKLYKIDKYTLQIKEISNRFVERCLINGFNTNYTVDQTAAGAPTQINGGQSQVFQIGAKELYTISLLDPNLGSQKITHVYDNDEQIWTTWSTAFGASFVQDSLGFIGSQACTHNSVSAATTIFVDNLASGAASAPRLMQMSPDLNKWDELPPGGGHNQFLFGWVSDIQDFGNRKRKFMDRLEILYDMRSTVSPNPAASTYAVTLVYKDYDYNPTSGFMVSRTIPLDEGSGIRAVARRLGSFRRRNFEILFGANAPLRIWAIEVDYNQGETDQSG